VWRAGARFSFFPCKPFSFFFLKFFSFFRRVFFSSSSSFHRRAPVPKDLQRDIRKAAYRKRRQRGSFTAVHAPACNKEMQNQTGARGKEMVQNGR
jgi:hypothetical protein